MTELRPTAEELERLRAAIPPDVHFGTSTWTYPGWTGLVYSKPYPASGATAKMLAEYARFPLFSTVGIDSSFYGPPKATSLTNWGRALPAGFRCVSKVWDRLTVFASKGQRNPDFLNADLFHSDIWEPYQAHFADHTGPFVFEFQTISRNDRVTPDHFAGLLDQFLGRLPTEGQYGIEIRNDDFLSPAYFAVLREHGVAHVFQFLDPDAVDRRAIGSSRFDHRPFYRGPSPPQTRPDLRRCGGPIPTLRPDPGTQCSVAE